MGEHVDPFSFLGGEVSRPSAVVLPGSVEEVQAIVGIAADHGVPLWTVSRGKNFGYGGASPRVDGSVVVDLHRMDRVLEVDDETGYVVVEPGVTFLAMAEHLRAVGSPADAVGARHRLGQRHRQHARTGLRLHRPR